ncbi:MAG: hypothetical protein ACRC6X_02500 [Culicoidibacterales bacterium]
MKKLKKLLVNVFIVFMGVLVVAAPLQAAKSWQEDSYDGHGWSGVIGWTVKSGVDDIYARTAVGDSSPHGPCLYFDYRTRSYYSGAPVASHCIMGASSFQKSIKISGVRGTYSNHSHSHPQAPWTQDNITSPTYI